MAKFRTKIPLSLVIVCCIVLAGVLAPFAIFQRREFTKALICDQCGIRLWIASDELVGSSAPAREKRTLEHTKLSLWFTSQITTNCHHSWKFNHSSGQTYVNLSGIRLWKLSGVSGSSPTPPIIYFSAEDRAR